MEYCKGVERLSPYYYYYYPLRWKQEEAATASIAQRSSDGAMRTAGERSGAPGASSGELSSGSSFRVGDIEAIHEFSKVFRSN